MKKFCSRLFLFVFLLSSNSLFAQCNVNDTVNTFYRFLNPSGPGEFTGFLCTSIDSVGTAGLNGYYDGSGFSVRLIAGTEVIFSVDSCTGNPVSLTIVDSANVIIPGAYSASACNNTLDFVATYTGLYSVVLNLNGICGGAGTNLIGQVYVKIKSGTTAPACSGVINDTICGAIQLQIDSGFSAGNSSDAYPTDPMDLYLVSIGATTCSTPNNTMWYYFQSDVNVDTLNIWVTSGVTSGFHSWISGFLANDTSDFCNGGLTFLGCNTGAADEVGIDTMSFQIFGLLANRVYVLMIDGFNGGAGPFSIALKSMPHQTAVDELKTDDFNIYPNPATDEIHINTEKQTGKVIVSLCNYLGAKVYCKITENPGNMIVPVSGLSAGIYFLTIQTKKGYFQKKINILGHQ